MAASLRLARRKAQKAAALSRSRDVESLLQQTSKLRLNVDSPEELRPGFETKALVPVETRPADFQQLGRTQVLSFHYLPLLYYCTIGAK